MERHRRRLALIAAMTEPGEAVGYVRVAGQLRAMIIDGRLKPGERLPAELELCELFGVSRSTLREALKVLASQHLITTARGPGGGNTVAMPRTGDVSEHLMATLDLMAGSDQFTVAELVQARELLEVPATRLAALQRTDDHLAQLRIAVPPSYERLSDQRIYETNRSFHRTVLAAGGNRVVEMLTEPVFVVLQRRVHRDHGAPEAWRQIIEEHAEILAAIEARDPEKAGVLMEEHLRGLRPMYERLGGRV